MVFVLRAAMGSEDKEKEASAGAEEKEAGRPLKLTVQLISGEALSVVEARDSWTVADVRRRLLPALAPGTDLASLLCGARALEAEQTLAECGLEGHAELSAVVVGVPTLHLSAPCSSAELAGTSWKQRGRRDFWIVGGSSDTPLVKLGVQHLAIGDAPEAARAVAAALGEAFPGLADMQVCRSSEGGDAGEVVVIVNPGADAKAACFAALAIRDDIEGVGSLRDRAEVDERDWSAHLKCGFNGNPDEEEEDDTEPGNLAMTKIMAERLTKGFMFTFSERVVCAPMLFGGYSSDGSIVGVLTSRVWT